MASAQQTPHFSQYMLQKNYLNPAVAGIEAHYEITSGHRFQWLEVTDPPVTNLLSFSGPHSKLPMGFGATIYTDATGPTSRTGLNAAYSYNIRIDNRYRLSFGLSAGIMQYKLDGTQLRIKDLSDPAIQSCVYNSWIPDATAGVYFYSDKAWAGFSVGQLLNNKLKLFDQNTGLNKLKSHFFVMGGYNVEINRDLEVRPSLLGKVTNPGIFEVDISSLLVYKAKLWGGLAWRYTEAFSVMIGYQTDNRLFFSYAYDLGMGDIRRYHSGSHELMLGYRFRKVRQ